MTEHLFRNAFKVDLRRYSKVVVALLDAGANADFTTPPLWLRRDCAGFTPLMYAAKGGARRKLLATT
jgi:hypothetical protein